MTDSAFNLSFGQISVQELAELLALKPPNLQLIDVREPEEIAIAYIPGFQVLPLSEYAVWAENIAQDFDSQVETLVLCHHGMRSAQMCAWLTRQGFTNVKNILGGIAAYSQLIDSSIPQY